MTSLNIAKLHGIGKIEAPQPEHYREALGYLHRESCGRYIPSPMSLRVRLADTLRRLEWTPKQRDKC